MHVPRRRAGGAQNKRHFMSLDSRGTDKHSQGRTDDCTRDVCVYAILTTHRLRSLIHEKCSGKAPRLASLRGKLVCPLICVDFAPPPHAPLRLVWLQDIGFPCKFILYGVLQLVMEKFLRSWRQDALNRGQHDAAIYIGDKVLALTSKLAPSKGRFAWVLANCAFGELNR